MNDSNGTTQDEVLLDFDCETTGTETDDETWQIAYRVRRGRRTLVERNVRVRTTKAPNPWVLEHTAYAKPYTIPLVSERGMLEMMFDDVRAASADPAKPQAIIVGANPGFDRARLQYHHERHGAGIPEFFSPKTIGVENHTQALFNLPAPPKLKECAALLGIERRGDSHDALSDVDLSQRCHLRLMDIEERVVDTAKAVLSEIISLDTVNEGFAADESAEPAA